MRLIDADEADRLYGVMGPGRECRGGSAGQHRRRPGRTGRHGRAIIGQVATDQLGEIYMHDITQPGVEFSLRRAATSGATARS